MNVRRRAGKTIYSERVIFFCQDDEFKFNRWRDRNNDVEKAGHSLRRCVTNRRTAFKTRTRRAYFFCALHDDSAERASKKLDHSHGGIKTAIVYKYHSVPPRSLREEIYDHGAYDVVQTLRVMFRRVCV